MPKILAISFFLFMIVMAGSGYARGVTRKAKHQNTSSELVAPAPAPQPINLPQLKYDSHQEKGSKDDPVYISLPERTWIDWISYLANLVLVAVGIGGIWVGASTLKRIERQTAAMERQLEIQREMLRPRLNISSVLNDVYTEAVSGKRVFIQVKISNSGGMPAYGVISETWIEFVDRGPIERPFVLSSKAVYHKAAPVNVDTNEPQAFELPFNRNLTPAEINRMHDAMGTICFRIRMTYNAFGQECHSDQGFVIVPGAATNIAEYTSAD